MPPLRLVPGIVLVLAAATLACRDTRTGVIAFVPGAPVVGDLVRDEIAARAAGEGHALRIVTDSGGFGTEADVEVRRAQRVVSLPGIVAVVGHGGSRASLAAAPIYADSGVPMVIPTATSRLLAAAGPWTFLMAPDDSVEGAFIARFTAGHLAARRVSVFFQNDEYGVGIRDGAVAELARLGVEVLFSSPVRTAGDLEPIVEASLREGRPDAVIVAAQPGEVGSLAQLFQQRTGGMAIVAGDGALLMPWLPTAAGAAADSVYAVSFWLSDAPDSASRAFAASFRQATGRLPQGNEAMSYDALRLVVEAVRVVGPSRRAVRDYFESLGRGRPPYQGVTGAITFGPGRPSRLVMARLRNGEAIRVDSASR